MSTPPPLPANNRKPTLPWIIGGVCAFLLLSLIGIAAIIVFSDDPPVDDSAMRPKWHSEEERTSNPLAEFLEWLEEHPVEKDERFTLAGSKTNWDQAAAESLLAEHEEHLAAVEKLLATSPETWLWPSGPAMAHIDAPSPRARAREPNAIQYVGNLLSIRSKAAAKPDMAITYAGGAMRFGASLAGAEGTAIHTLVAVGVYAQALGALKAAVIRRNARETDLSLALELLQKQAPASRDVAFTLKVEHEMFANTLAGLASGRIKSLPGGGSMDSLRGFMKVRRGLRRSLTLNQPLVDSLESGWESVPHALSIHSDQFAKLTANRFRVLSDGVSGIVLTQFFSTTEGILRVHLDTETQRRLAIAQIGLRQYELTNGHLPASLAELKLPGADIIDPWSQAPLIWNRDKLLLYSVARNGTDDGGSFNTAKPREGPDRGGRYWWAPAE